MEYLTQPCNEQSFCLDVYSCWETAYLSSFGANKETNKQNYPSHINFEYHNFIHV
jgi:hypothetical protein